MNVAPLTPQEREEMIVCLAEGLTPRAAQLMRDTLSDGHLRTIYEHEQRRATDSAVKEAS